ncbi:MAG: TolC family protein [Bacteroidota bacterium]|nr:TolC family protein [Bacteroidota bacterium]
MPVILAFTLASTAYSQVPAQDTLRMTAPEIEKRFIDSNLLLLAAHYQVDAQKALIDQARLWDNPVLNTDQVIAANGHFFPYGKNPDGSFNGQYYVQVQQLIKTAGKRGKLINLATTNAKLSELSLQDVLRNLRYQLRTDFYSLRQQLANLQIFDNQLSQLNLLLSGMGAQLKAGNIAEKEYLRLQALVNATQQDKADLQKTIADTQSDLKTLLQIKDDVFIKPVTGDIPQTDLSGISNIDMLFETAKKNNPNYLLQQTQTVFQEQNLSYQKALRVPDLTFGPNFDRNSNYAPNYIGMSISLPIPLLNKNQGNIKSAEFGIMQQKTLVSAAETELKNNLATAYQKLLLSLKQITPSQTAFYRKYSDMYDNVVKSYQAKQISLLEFLDFFDDYTNAQIRMYQQKLNLQLAREELNYQTGIDIVK